MCRRDRETLERKQVDRDLTSDPVKSPILRRIFDENSQGAADPKVPMLIAHGGNDEQIPVDISATLAAKYRRLGASVTRRTYPDIDHEGVVDAAAKDIISWMTARLKGQAATNRPKVFVNHLCARLRTRGAGLTNLRLLDASALGNGARHARTRKAGERTRNGDRAGQRVGSEIWSSTGG